MSKDKNLSTKPEPEAPPAPTETQPPTLQDAIANNVDFVATLAGHYKNMRTVDVITIFNITLQYHLSLQQLAAQRQSPFTPTALAEETPNGES